MSSGGGDGFMASSWRLTTIFLAFLFFFTQSQCGGSGVDLAGDDSNLDNPPAGDDDDDEITVGLTSETVEDEEVVFSTEDDGEVTTNEEIATIAPEMGIITADSAYLDCSTRTEEGDPELDYVSLTCTNDAGTSTIEYRFYCTASADDSEVFVVNRIIGSDTSTAEELWDTIIITCEENTDGETEFFEEEYIVS